MAPLGVSHFYAGLQQLIAGGCPPRPSLYSCAPFPLVCSNFLLFQRCLVLGWVQAQHIVYASLAYFQNAAAICATTARLGFGS